MICTQSPGSSPFFFFAATRHSSTSYLFLSFLFFFVIGSLFFGCQITGSDSSFHSVFFLVVVLWSLSLFFLLSCFPGAEDLIAG